MGKTALVISGGGSKGAFAVGVVKLLKEQYSHIDFDIYVGTSTGSLIVPLVALGRIDLLEQMYTTVHTEDIVTGGNVVARLVNDISLFDATPLGNLVKQYYDDINAAKILSLDKQILVTTTCLQTNNLVTFSTAAPPVASNYTIVKLNNPKEFRRAVMASACQPVFMQPIEVHENAQPVRQYVDGGVREYMGIQLAIDAGAEEVFAIALSPKEEHEENKRYTKAIDILFKTIDIFSTDVNANDVRIPQIYNKALRYIAAVKNKMIQSGVNEAAVNEYFNIPSHNLFAGKKPVKLHMIYPKQSLGGGPGGLQFDPEEMKGMLASGENIIKDYMASLPVDGSADV